jgi:hypothetical protein
MEVGQGPKWGCSAKEKRTFGLHKMLGISWEAELLVASQEGLGSMELVIPILSKLNKLQRKLLISLYIMQYKFSSLLPN